MYFLQHIVERAPVVNLRERITEGLQAQKFTVNRRRDDFSARAPQLQAAGDHVSVEKNQQRDQSQEKLAGNGDLKMQRPLAQDGAGEKDRHQARPYQDARADNDDPLLKVTLLQGRQLLAEPGEDALRLDFQVPLVPVPS